MKDLFFFKNTKIVAENIVKEGVKFLEENPEIKSFVLGISGGIDSTVTAALAAKIREASDKRIKVIREASDKRIKVIGRSMPIISNTKEEITNAWHVGKAFCDDFKEDDLSVAAEGACEMLAPDIWKAYSEKGGKLSHDLAVRFGNLKARLRMMKLYDLARKHNGVVLSTDNLTEYYLGFWTLHGDVGDLGFIQELWKTEVYSLADYLAEAYAAESDKYQHDVLEDITEAKPTDGLGVSDSDLDQIAPELVSLKDTMSFRKMYGIVDDMLIDHIMNGTPYDNEAIKRVRQTEFKRNNPISFKRGILTWVYNT
jgi:NAD+ synthase